MGYERPKKTFVLQFGEDSEYAGLEVRARSASVGGLMELLGLTRLQDMKKLDPDDIKDIDGLFRLFASKLESWNLEDNGVPVSLEPTIVRAPSDVPNEVKFERETPAEAKYRALMDQDMDFVMDLVFAWIDGMVGTPGPLEKTSIGGGRSEEELIPMVELSGALPH